MIRTSRPSSSQDHRASQLHLGRRVVSLLAALVVVGGGLVSCSLPADDQVTTFSPDDLPIDLTSPSTTTTTTSTTTTTTTLASTGGETIDSPPTTTTPPTTTPIVEREPIRVFYRVSLTGDSMTRVTVNLATPVQLMAVVRELEVPNDEIRATGVRTSVRVNLIEAVEVDRGIATVELSNDELDKMSLQEQQRAIAQIVLTLTSFVTPDAGAIALVSFSVDGEPISVFLPDGTNTEAGEPVAFADYVVLVEGQPTTTTITTTTTTTTSTTTTTPVDTTLPVNTNLPTPLATTPASSG